MAYNSGMNEVLAETRLPNRLALQLVRGDLAIEAVDAIVNAANRDLSHGGGVAGHIARRGGPSIQRESDEWRRERGPVTHASPAWTNAGDLPCRFVIHAVGPVWGEGDEDAKLAAALGGSLRLADELGAVSISLPAISTGIFGFPRERAAPIFFDAIAAHAPQTLRQVRLVLYDAPTLEVFQRAWDARWGTK